MATRNRAGAFKRQIPSWAKAITSLGLAAAVGIGLAVVDGAFATTPAAGASVQANPVSSVMINAMTAGTSARITPLAAGSSAAMTAEKAAGTTVSQSLANGAALGMLRHPGSQVLGTSLAYATLPRYGSQRKLVWLVSVDPAGGLYSIQPPQRLANYCVQIIDASTGKWLMMSAGRSPSLAALPEIPAK
jgi:hypothetical protein